MPWVRLALTVLVFAVLWGPFPAATARAQPGAGDDSVAAVAQPETGDDPGAVVEQLGAGGDPVTGEEQPEADDDETVGATSPAAPRSRPVLVVAVIDRGAGPERDRALRTMIAHLSDMPVQVIVAHSDMTGLREQIAWAGTAAERHHAVGVLWLDLEPEDHLVLYLVEPDTEQAMVRAIPRDPEGAAATFTAAGIIARSIAVALLEGQQVGMRPVDLPDEVEQEEPAPEVVRRAPARTPAPWPRLRLSALYLGTNFADQVPWQNGVGLDVQVRPMPSFLLGAGYVFVLPSHVGDPAVEFVVQRNPVKVFAGYHGRVSRAIAVEIEPRFEIDPVRQRVLEVDPGYEQVSSRTRVVLGVGACARVVWSVFRGLALHAGVGVDMLLNPFDYVLRVDDGTERVLRLHPVRGEVTAGLSYGLIVRDRAR